MTTMSFSERLSAPVAEYRGQGWVPDLIFATGDIAYSGKQQEYELVAGFFERPLETEKGDVHGRIDRASLGGSVHLVGYCLSRLGRDEEARPWYERAVAEAGERRRARAHRPREPVHNLARRSGTFAAPWTNRARPVSGTGKLWRPARLPTPAELIRTACVRGRTPTRFPQRPFPSA